MQTSNVIQNLYAAEIALAERTAGLSIATLEDPNFPKIALLGALGWVAAKRDEPGLKYDFYMSNRTLEQITAELGIEDDEDGEQEGEAQEA